LITADTLLPFLFASTALAIAPGPDNLFVLAQSALYGKKAGILITLGLCTGLCFHTVLVALGMAVILQSAMALILLKLIGSSYLLFLAYKVLRSHSLPIENSIQLSNTALYQRGIIMNITNPKVSLFFLAFLPQFIPTQSESFAVQTCLLGSLFALTSFCVFSGIAYAGGQLQHKLEHSPTLLLSLNRVAGFVFIVLAINLLR